MRLRTKGMVSILHAMALAVGADRLDPLVPRDGLSHVLGWPRPKGVIDEARGLDPLHSDMAPPQITHPLLDQAKLKSLFLGC